MKNRKLLLIVSLVLALTMSLGGTLAYLQDTDEAVNVMTLGNVKVEQFEMERVFDENGNVTGMQPFTQGQPLYPVYNPNGNGAWQPNNDVDVWYNEYIDGAAGGNGTWQGMTGAIDKFVFVKNTGTADLYYRTWIAVEADTTKTLNAQGQNMIHLNVNGNSLFQWTPAEKGDKSMGIVEIDGANYNIYLATYTAKLTPGEISRPSLLQIGMDENAANEYVAQFGDTFEVLAFTQAVQTNNMPDAETALNVAFGKVVEEDGTINHPWQDGVAGLPTTTVKTAAELKAAMEKGGIIVVAEDIVVEEALTVPAGVEVELILNGNISQEFAQTTAYAMIENKGELTISGTGKISYKDTGAGGEYASNTIKNEGILNIKGGTIENISSDEMMSKGYPHAIDAYQGSVTNISGGTVKSTNYDCIRMFCNSTTLKTEVNISGGNIINRVSFQNPNNNTHTPGYGRLNITGGTFTTTDGVNANVRLLNFSKDYSNMKATISGGTFDKGVKTQDYTSTITGLADWLSVTNVTVNEVK